MTVRIEIVRGSEASHFERLVIADRFEEFCSAASRIGFHTGQTFYPAKMVGTITIEGETNE